MGEYDRYIKRGDKVYGPYKYSNRKENGRVVSEYLGKSEPVKKNKIIRFIQSFMFVFLTLFLLVFLIYGISNITGKVTFSSNTEYAFGDKITGSVKINLDEGDLLPARTSLIVSYGSDTNSHALKDLINVPVVFGNFTVKGTNISGVGEGFSERIIEEPVYVEFYFKVYELNEGNSSESISEGNGEQNLIEENLSGDNSSLILNETEEINLEENNSKSVEENNVEENVAEENESQEEIIIEGEFSIQEDLILEEDAEENLEEDVVEEEIPSENLDAEISLVKLMTGEAVLEESEEEYYIVRGEVIFGEAYNYDLGNYSRVEFLNSSEEINFEIKDGQVIVNTTYLEKTKINSYEIDLSNLNLIADKEGEINFTLSYEGEELYSWSKYVSLVPDELEIVENVTDLINETQLNDTILNESVINETIVVGNVSINVNTTQYGAVVGMPVKWKKVVKSDSSTNISVELPKEAVNISVYKVNSESRAVAENNFEEENLSIDNSSLIVVENISLFEEENISLIENETEKEILVEENNSELVEEMNETESVSFSITGNAIKNKGFFASISGRAVDISESDESISVMIEEEGTEFEIEYETPAPVIYERNDVYGKDIVISSDVHYENILAYTELLKPTSLENVRLYHIQNGTRVLSEFQAYDFEGNLISGEEVVIVAPSSSNDSEIIYGENETNNETNITIKDVVNFTQESVEANMVSFITWVVPHLSNQTYQLVIEISAAEHLDENRSFIEDVYMNVSAIDSIFAQIPSGNYLRVTFEIPIDNTRDITVYGFGNGSIEIYKKDSLNLLGVIENITELNYYKFYLTTLIGEETTFDLKIVGNLSIDYVVDPDSPPLIEFVSPPTPENEELFYYYPGISISTEVSIEDDLGAFGFLDVDSSAVMWQTFDDTEGSPINFYDTLQGDTLSSTGASSIPGISGNAVRLDKYSHFEVADSSEKYASREFAVSMWVNYTEPEEFVQVSMGQSHACALDAGGKGYCWGANERGQLGDGTTSFYSSAGYRNFLTPIIGDYTFSMITAGTDHSCGLLTNGSAVCWGNGGYGRLGFPSGLTGTPGFVSGGYNFSKISAGNVHTCGILVNGTALCWGMGAAGRLGDGFENDSDSPVFVSGGHNFSSIIGGASHTCGILVNGTALCWGDNEKGQLGDGTITTRAVPTPVLGDYTFSTIAPGGSHSCGVLINSSAVCWGSDSYGRLGDGGSEVDSYVPVFVSGNYLFSFLYANLHDNPFTCGILTNGSAVCWGRNMAGNLGDGTRSNRAIPTFVIGNNLFSSQGDLKISGGRYSTCGILSNGGVTCWGSGGAGIYGDGTFTFEMRKPSYAIGQYSKFSLGASHTCGILTNGSTVCWGRNAEYQLGDSTTETKIFPNFVSGNYNFKEIALGMKTSCGILANGNAMCWGLGERGILGDGSTSNNPVPNLVSGSYEFNRISVGNYHACGVLVNGSGMCWGYNNYGQLGKGEENKGEHRIPYSIYGDYNFSMISAGVNYFTCGVLTNGTAMCWGANGEGQLGIGNTTIMYVPTPVLGEYFFNSISVGGTQTCGILINGTAMCWGRNNQGQLGIGNTTNMYVPTPVLGDYNFSLIYSGGEHTCGVLTNGSAMCWGRNNEGQLGDGTTSHRTVPVAVLVEEILFEELGLGDRHTCGILEDGELMCWGNNEDGRLGVNSYYDGYSMNSPRTTVLNSILFGKSSNNYLFGIDTSGDLVAKIYGTVLNTSVEEGWNHIAFSNSFEDGFKLYLNGVIVNSFPFHIHPTVDSTLNLQIGSNVESSFDEILYFNRSLSEGEISALSFSNSTSLVFEKEYVPGEYSLTAYSKDTGGSVNLTDERIFYVYEILPELNFSSDTLENNSNISQSYIPLGVDVDFAEYESTFNLYDSEGVLINSTTLENTASYNFTGLSSGIYYYNVGVVGEYSTGSTSNRTIFLDLSSPIVELVSPTPEDGIITNSNSEMVNATINDSLETFSFFNQGDDVLFYSFDDLSGKEEIQGNNGTLYGGRVVPGITGGAISFEDGEKMAMPYSSVFDSAEEFSLSMFIEGDIDTSEFVQISAGYKHVCGVTVEGRIYCWGDNTYNQLGEGTTTWKSVPVLVSGNYNFSKVSCGGQHTCGLLTNGSAMCWGRNNVAQLGDGTQTQRSTPVFVNATYNFSSVFAGNTHSCGLLTNGSAMCWGYNVFGELGDETKTRRNSPVFVSGGYEFKNFTLGHYHTCGLLTNGSAMCWGGNAGVGALGDGESTDKSIPTFVSGGYEFDKISSKGSNTCAILANGTAMCWGYNSQGQLGDGTTSPKFVPGYVLGDYVFSDVFLGMAHTCGFLTNGSAMCWGNNFWGQFGDGTMTNSLLPKISNENQYSQLTLGSYFTCGKLTNGTVMCWGINAEGQLARGGNSIAADMLKPVYVIDSMMGEEKFVQIDSSKGNFTCGILTNGTAMCWGQNNYGQLGLGERENSWEHVPRYVQGDYVFRQIKLGEAHVCGLLTNGSAMCWGYNGNGQLGDGTNESKNAPVFVYGDYNFSSIDSFNQNTCGLLVNDSAMCWGANYSESFGVPYDIENNTIPNFVYGNYKFMKLVNGPGHSCGLLINGTALCWGNNWAGRVGIGVDGGTVYIPTPVYGNYSFKDISVGQDHSCGLLINGTALCWGDNWAGTIGDGTTARPKLFPTPPLGDYVFEKIFAGSYSSCGVLTNGTALCWGRNEEGSLGDGTTTQRNSPVPVSGNYLFDQVSLGRYHGCGILQDGTALCWGTNVPGNLGINQYGWALFSTVPKPILRANILSMNKLGYALALDQAGELVAVVREEHIPFGQLNEGMNHIVLNKNLSQVQIYVNGEERASLLSRIRVQLFAHTFTLFGGGGNATIDDLLITGRSLSENEISGLSLTGNSVFEFVPNWKEGNENYSVYSVDKTGNVGESETRSLFIDSISPDVEYSFMTLEDNSFVPQNHIHVFLDINEVNGYNTTFNFYDDNGIVLSTTLENTSHYDLTDLSDGIYYYNASVEDIAGNVNSTETRKIVLDTTSPNVNFSENTLANTSYASQSNIYVELDIEDVNEYNTTFYFYEEFNLLFNITLENINNYNFTVIFDGEYYYNATVVDSAGNMNSTETRNVILDSVYPDLEYTNNTLANNSFVSQNYIYVETEISDSSVFNTTFNFFNETDLIFEVILENGLIYNLTGLSDGVYYYNVSAMDLAGNENFVRLRKITLDTVSPTISYTENVLANNSYVSQSNIYVELNITDVNEYNTTFNFFNETDLILNVTLENLGEYNLTSLADGIYYYNTSIIDLAQNTNETETRRIVLDTVSPTISYTENVLANNSYVSQSNIYVELDITDVNEYNTTFYFYNETDLVFNTTLENLNSYNLTSLADGIYYYNTSIIDLAQNTNETETRRIVLDVTNPSISYSENTLENNSYVSQSNIYVELDITDVNEYNTTFYFYNETDLVFNITLENLGEYNLTSLADGIYYYNTSIIDLAQNTNETETRRIVLDTVSPTISYTENVLANNSYVSQSNIYVELDIEDVNEYNTTFYFYNETDLVFNTTLENLGEYNLTSLADGIYYYNTSIIDLAQNVNSTETRRIVLDVTNPSISYSENTLENNSYVSQSNIYVELDITDVNEYNTTFYFYNETDLILNVTLENMNSYNLTSLADGIYYYNTSIIDLAQNTNETETRRIVLDTVSPTISYTENVLANNSYVSQSNIYVELDIEDVNEYNTTFYFYNETDLVFNTTLENLNSYNLTSLADGIYYYNTSIIDLAQNVNSTETRRIVLDVTNPSISYSENTLENNSYVSQSNIYVELDIEDVNEYNTTFYFYNETDLILNVTLENMNSYNLTSLADGIYYYNTSIIDLAQNTNETETRRIVLDTVSPTISYTENVLANNSYVSQSNIYVELDIEDVNEYNTTFYFYNETDLVFNTTLENLNSYNLTSLADGIYYYNTSIIDLAQNVNSTETRRIVLDVTNPSISYSENTLENNSYVSQSNIYVELDIEDVNEYNTTFYFYNETDLILNVTLENMNSYNLTSLADGIYYYNTSIIDLAQNTNETETRRIVLDTVSPTISYTENVLANNSYVSQSNIYVELDIEDVNEYNTTFYFYNETDLVFNTTLENLNSYNLTSLADGIYYYNTSIIDLAQNVNSTETRRIVLDVTNPSISYSENTLENNSYVSQSNIYVELDIEDVNEYNTTFYFYNETDLILNVTLENMNSYNLTSLADGIYYYNTSIIDLAQNVNSTETRRIVLDVTSPVFNYVFPVNGTRVNTTTQGVPLEIFVEDFLEIVNCTYSINSASYLLMDKINETFFSKNLLDLEKGETNLSIICMDYVGNYKMNDSVFYTYWTSNISVNAIGEIDTQEELNIYGNLQSVEGEILGNAPYLVSLDGKLISSGKYNSSSFLSEDLENIEAGNNLTLTYGSSTEVINYVDDYSTTKYLNDSLSYTDAGYDSGRGVLFSYNDLIEPVGEIVYQFDSPTQFSSFFVEFNTGFSQSPGGNSSVWYSYDNSNWMYLNSTISAYSTVISELPLSGQDVIYVKLKSDTQMFSSETPISEFKVNYTHVSYASSGYYISNSINLGNVAYTTIDWEGNETSGSVTLQVRESEDMVSWGDWSEELLEMSENDITHLSKSFVQFRVNIENGEFFETPLVDSVIVNYFNERTDEEGNYNFTFTVPIVNLGNRILEVSVSPKFSYVFGSTQKMIDIWAKTNVTLNPYQTYYTNNAKYHVDVNLSRLDTLNLTEGEIFVNVSNSTFSKQTSCQTINGNCIAEFGIPSNFSSGEYNVTVLGTNESGYLRNSTQTYLDYIESHMTTGSLFIDNVSISGFKLGIDYPLNVTAIINNTGTGTMRDVHVFDYLPARSVGIANITELTYCSELLPGESCENLINIVVSGGAQVGDTFPHFISWRANWTDNNDLVVGGVGFISFTGMNIVLEGNSSVGASVDNVSVSSNDGQIIMMPFNVTSIGSIDVNDVNLVFLEGNTSEDTETLPSSWISFGNSFFSTIPPGMYGESSLIGNIPRYTAPGNYSGMINITSLLGSYKEIPVNFEVLYNGNWTVQPLENNTNNISFSLDVEGEVANYTIVNNGNFDLLFGIEYEPTGETSYAAFGTQLFQENYWVGDTIYNPTSLFVPLNENRTITLYQKGSSNKLDDVGILVSISNSSAQPSEIVVKDTFYIFDKPPQIEEIFFYQDEEVKDIFEQNKQMNIKIKVTDDMGINISSLRANITHRGTTTTYIPTPLSSTLGEYTRSGIYYVVLNYSLSYLPSTFGDYLVKAFVEDVNGAQVISSDYEFVVEGGSNLNFNVSNSTVNITAVDKYNSENFTINYSIENIGNVAVYLTKINFTSNIVGLEAPNVSIGTLNESQEEIREINVKVPSLTPPGEYSLIGNLSWRNPNGTVTSKAQEIVITVFENKSISLVSPLDVSLEYMVQNETTLSIENTGNSNLTGMSVICVNPSLCSLLDFYLNETYFTVLLNQTKELSLAMFADEQVYGQNYSVQYLISDSMIEEVQIVNVDVEEYYSWETSPEVVSEIKAKGSSGLLKVVNLTNTGNVNMSFSLSSQNESLITLNESWFSVPKGESKEFEILYEVPNLEGNYSSEILITPEQDSPQQSLNVEIYSTNVRMDLIYPNSLDRVLEALAGDLIHLEVNASYLDEPLGENSNWRIYVGGQECGNLTSNQDGFLWDFSCNLPVLEDGKNYSVTSVMISEEYGTVSITENNLINYLDLSPPSFSVVRNNIYLGSDVDLRVAVTDNVQVDKVWFNMTSPSGENYSGSMDYIYGYYRFSDFTPSEPGEYMVNYSSNDTRGNINSTLDWFEVYDKYYFPVTITDYSNLPISGVNFVFYRPNTSLILEQGITDNSGYKLFNLNKRFYDVKIFLSNDTITYRNVDFSNSSDLPSFNFYRLSGELLEQVIPLHKPFMGISSNSSGIEESSVGVVFKYAGYNYDVPTALRIVKCSNWNYLGRNCSGSWEVLTSQRDLDSTTISANSTGSSVYFLAENRCGNGMCEANYGETTSTCSADCIPTPVTPPSSGGSSGGGGGSSGLSSADLTKIENIIKNYLDVGGLKLETSSIYKELFAGESTSVRVKVKNTVNSPANMGLSTQGEIRGFVSFESSSLTLSASEERDIPIKLTVPKFTEPGTYDGDLIIESSGAKGSIPITIKVLSPEGRLLDVKVQPLTETVAPGEMLRLQTDLLNLGKTKRVDVQFDLQLIDIQTGEIVTRFEEAFAVETSMSVVKNITVPADTPEGKYMIKAIAYYSNIELEGDMQASSIAYVRVQAHFFERILFGVIPLWTVVFGIIFIIFVILGIYYYKWLEMKRRKFKSKVDLSKIPKVSSNSIFVGRIAELGNRAFLPLNSMKTHTLIAGQTGSGKTVAAQDLVEGALLKNKCVIVFDPTAQWSGFLRKCDDKKMLARYRYFDMKVTEARAFEGTIKVIKNPFEKINLEKYMNRPGEITIFDVSNLTPKEVDIVVANSIEQVFRSAPEESTELKNLFVYDEVHRLLPKFGGSGQGFIQIERGAREFRKWGIGLLLISQVLSDFVGEVKANIGTEIQMGTRYEGDLERINMKYGEDVLKSVVKEPAGTGMVVNAEFNDGRPYFVSFRPLLHNTKRLLKAELEQYDKYYLEYEDLEFQVEKLKELGVDTLDLELELKMCRGKIKEGKFQMVDMYYESLKPRIQETWMSLNMEPQHIVRERINKQEYLLSLNEAKKERAEYVKNAPTEEINPMELLSQVSRIIETKKRQGKITSGSEIKLEAIKNSIKSKGNSFSESDMKLFKSDLDSLIKEVESL